MQLALLLNLGSWLLASNVEAIATPSAGLDQVVTIPHDGHPTTFVHNTLLNGSAVDPNGDPLIHHWMCPTATQVNVGCITSRLQLNNYGGAKDHPFVAYNDTCELTYDGNHDGGARPFAGKQILQTTSNVYSTDLMTRVLLPAGVHVCTLTSTDSYGSAASDNVTITVNPEPNAEPVAHAGPDQNVTVPHDEDPTAGSMTNNAVINKHDGLPEHDFKRTPTGYSAQRRAQTKWALVTLNASQSYDADNDVLRYQWTCPGSGTNTTGAVVSIWLSADAKDGQKYLEQSNSYTCCDGVPAVDIVNATSGAVITGYNVGCPNDGGTGSTCQLHCDSETNCKSVGAQVCSTIPQCKAISINSARTVVTLKKGMPDCMAGGDLLQCTKPPKVQMTRWVHRCNLTVEDTYGAYSMDSVDISINTEPNHVPVASAGSNQDVTVPHDGDPDTNLVLVTLDGSLTTDMDSDRLDFFWSCKVGSNEYATSTGKITTIPLRGPTSNWHNNICTLTVTDTYGATSSDTVTIKTRAEPNSKPDITLGSIPEYTIPHDGDPLTNTVMVTLPGFSSSDQEDYMSPDGKVKLVTKDDVLTYLWECPTANVVSTDATTVVPMIQGNHGCTLTVTDTYGAKRTQTVTIKVNPEPNSKPDISIGSIPEYTIPHDGDPLTNTVMVTLPGYASSDTEDYMSPDGKVKLVTKDDVLTYLWECPTANVVSTDATTVVPMIQGNHGCTLTVTDTYGAKRTQTVTIKVNPEPNKKPVISIGSIPEYTIPHDGDPLTNTVMVTLPGYASSDTEDYMSPDGKVKLVTKDDVLTYLWECPTANVVSTDATAVVPMIQGNHGCTLTVTDTYGAGFHQTGQRKMTVTIKVNPEPNNTPNAHAGPDQTYTVPHDGRTFTNTVLVTLNASKTTDWEDYMSPDGKVQLVRKFDKLDYQWSCPTAGVTSSDMITVVPMLQGTHTCTLTVTDSYLAGFPTATGQKTDSAVITVNPEPNMGF